MTESRYDQGSLKSVPLQDDTHQWVTISEAASRKGDGLSHVDIHRLCNDGTLSYRVDDKGGWLINIPSLNEYLRRIMGLNHEPVVVRAVEYAALLGHLSRIEDKLNTITEGIVRMTAADTEIEADVTALRSAFASLGDLISTLNTTVSTLQGEVAAGGAPSAATLSDLGDITSKITGLVPTPSAPPSDTPVDTPPVTDPSAPVDTGVPDPTTTPDAGTEVTTPAGDTVVMPPEAPAPVDPVVGEEAPSDATPQAVDTPVQHQSP